jgi:hypothetical protein
MMMMMLQRLMLLLLPPNAALTSVIISFIFLLLQLHPIVDAVAATNGFRSKFRDSRINFSFYLRSSRRWQSPLDLAVAVATPILYANTNLALAVAALMSSGVLPQKVSASL